jgi:ribosomal protein S18 acetylase RimI-like enzyme
MTNPLYHIKIVKSDEDINIEHIAGLIAQLAPDSSPVDAKKINEINNSDDIVMMIATDNTNPPVIIGVLLVVIIKLLTSTKVQIEDVVVHETQRGRGIGKALLKAAISYAREISAAKIELTSTPDKTIANKLYNQLGFKKRNTNLYRLEL